MKGTSRKGNVKEGDIEEEEHREGEQGKHREQAGGNMGRHI